MRYLIAAAVLVACAWRALSQLDDISIDITTEGETHE